MGNRRTRLPSSGQAGAARRELWRMAKGRMERAMNQGFWLEAVALQESMMADRLESLLAADGTAVEFGTLGRLIDKVHKRWPDLKDDEHLAATRAWGNKRARELHEMVKLGDGHEDSWRERLALARETAVEGAELVKRVDALVARTRRAARSL